VSTILNLGASSSAGFTLKRNYGKFLFALECKFERGDIDPAPILASLEASTKKESKKAAAERAAAELGIYTVMIVINITHKNLNEK